MLNAMRYKALVLTVVMAAILAASDFVGFEILNKEQVADKFFVGVEMAYSNATFNDVKELVDKVKDYTNLFVIGSPEISLNESLLNMTCDYVYDAGLNFIILFTDTTKYSNDSKPYVWITKARQKYGNKFLAVYRFDEPGGSVLDHAKDSLINETDFIAPDYSLAAELYSYNLYSLISFYLYPSPSVITADYGLYWFDYNAGYSSVLAEFGNNHSREMNVGLCRGAAEAHGKDWGSIITWTYTKEPYVESPEELYQDLLLSYHTGAKYTVVFNYPKIGPYGILNQTHLDAMKNFWNYVQNNPQDYAIDRGEVAYVLPADYGFGFRSAVDHVWPFQADTLSAKVWNDTQMLLSKYSSHLDIVYDGNDFGAIAKRYSKLFFWNETIVVD